jgi:hypothetical protein
MPSATSRLWTGLTTRRLMIAVLFVAIFAMAIRQPADTDTWWHLKSGQLMWETGSLLRTDPFSHTVAGQPWINHSWLAQLLLWPVYQALGLGGLALLLAVVVTVTFGLVYTQCDGKPFVAALATLLAAVASSVIWAIRPQILSFLLAACVATLLAHYKQTGNRRWLWAIPFLVIFWVNCHAGFVVAFILMGCYLLGETLNRLTSRSPALSQAPIRPLILTLLISIPCILLNPHSFRMVVYAFETVSIGPLQEFIQEWSVPNFHNLQLHPFIWLLLLTLAAMGLSRRRADWTDLALVGVFGYMALLAVRNIALFALVAPPILTQHAVAALDDLALVPRLSWLGALTHSRAPTRAPRPVALLNALLLVLILVGAGAKAGMELVQMHDPAVWGRDVPVAAVDYMRGHELPGQLFNTYNWGGYLIWSLYPDKPVFVDGRTDLYALNSNVLADYVTVHWVRPGWQQVLDQYAIGSLITEHASLLDVMMAQAEDWEAVYQDSQAVIYRRERGQP